MENRFAPFESVNKAKLETCVSLTNQAFEKAAGILPKIPHRYDHLAAVADPSRIVLLSKDEFVEFAKNDEEDGYVGFANGVYVLHGRNEIESDVVVLREDSLSTSVLLHEYIHRASSFSYINFYNSSAANRKIGRAISLKEDSKNKDQAKKPSKELIINHFREGITQWATFHLASGIFEIEPNERSVYRHELTFVNMFITQNLLSRGFDMPGIEGIMLDLALTWDFTFLDTAMKATPYRAGMRVKDVASIYQLVQDRSKSQKEIESTKIQTWRAEAGGSGGFW